MLSADPYDLSSCHVEAIPWRLPAEVGWLAFFGGAREKLPLHARRLPEAAILLVTFHRLLGGLCQPDGLAPRLVKIRAARCPRDGWRHGFEHRLQGEVPERVLSA